MLTRPKDHGLSFPLRYHGFPFSWQARAAPVHDVGKVGYT